MQIADAKKDALRPSASRRLGICLSLFCLLSLSSVRPGLGQQPVVAAQFHPPVDRPQAAAMQSFQIPSHGSLLNAFMYIAAGAGPHPAVILLHGLPGNERNLDIAQDMRRAGWDVLYMDYRGSWGSPGDFSFTHSVEDVADAVAYLRQPSVAARMQLDPKRIVLIGHSMGGFAAIQAAADDALIAAVGLISPVDFGGMVAQPSPKEQESAVLKGIAAGIAHQGIAPLSGCTPDGLARDILDHSQGWSFASRANSLKTRPIFLMTADDGWMSSNDLFAESLGSAGATLLTVRHLATDHSYSDQRSALSAEVLKWLGTLPLHAE